jgi:hypothetical protein
LMVTTIMLVSTNDMPRETNEQLYSFVVRRKHADGSETTSIRSMPAQTRPAHISIDDGVMRIELLALD